MPLRMKYPISEWVLSQENVSPGDIIAFYCEETRQEVHAEVLGFPSKELRQYISYRRLGSFDSEIVNFYNTIIYRVKRKAVAAQDCSCGAKHTSNPNYHLPYCSLKKEEDPFTT